MSAVVPTEAQCWRDFWEAIGPTIYHLGLTTRHETVQRINSVGALDMVREFEAAADCLRADRYEVWVGKMGEGKVALVALRHARADTEAGAKT